MRYGEGFWCVGKDGLRLDRRTYPKTAGFEYLDGTGDRGEFLLESFAIDYVPPGETDALRMCIFGDPCPLLHANSFDWDWASIPKLARSFTCDKADYRIRVASLFHDMGYCVQEIWPVLDRKFWDRLIFEVMEAYSVSRDDVEAAVKAAEGRLEKAKVRAKMEARYLADRCLRNEVLAGVRVGGGFVWKKPRREVEIYRGLFNIGSVPV